MCVIYIYIVGLLWNNSRDSWKFSAVFPSAAAPWQKQQRQLTATYWLSGWEAARTSLPSAEMKAGELLNFQGASGAPGEVADSSAAKVSSKSPQKSWALALLPSALTRCQVGFSRRGCKTSNMHLSQGCYSPPSWEVTTATLHHSNRRRGNNPFPQNRALFAIVAWGHPSREELVLFPE